MKETSKKTCLMSYTEENIVIERSYGLHFHLRSEEVSQGNGLQPLTLLGQAGGGRRWGGGEGQHLLNVGAKACQELSHCLPPTPHTLCQRLYVLHLLLLKIINDSMTERNGIIR